MSVQRGAARDGAGIIIQSTGPTQLIGLSEAPP